MKLLVGPILAGLGLEAALVAMFCIDPGSICGRALSAIAVVYLHRPGLVFAEHILGFTSWRQHLMVAPILMVVVWVSIFAVLRYLFQARD